MKKILVMIVIAMASLSCVKSGHDISSISSDAHESGSIIDVRTPEEYKEGHLEGAINIPYTEIGERIADQVENKQEKITVYCRSGRRSGIAKQTLEAMGYTNVINAGAYAALKEQQDNKQAR